MDVISMRELYKWCKIPYQELENHPKIKVPFRIVKNSEEMGRIMAEELLTLIRENNQKGRNTRAIIPCGPSCWYKPFTKMVNNQKVILKNLTVFHMDECLDWQLLYDIFLASQLSSDHKLQFVFSKLNLEKTG